MNDLSTTELLRRSRSQHGADRDAADHSANASAVDGQPTRCVDVPALGEESASGGEQVHFAESSSDDCVQLQDSLPKVGDRFLRFSLIGILGRGAFGNVYLARQSELADRLVALKISTEIRSEPENLARLQHANIVPIHSVHRSGTLQAVCMPYFGSVTLAHVIQTLGQLPGAFPKSGRGLLTAVFDRAATRRIPVSELPIDTATMPPTSPIRGMMERMNYVDAVLWIVSQIADGLAHAHERGILHRDLKPANILISDEGLPMLLDFNLAYDTHRPHPEDPVKLGGTLPYMSPELLDFCLGGQQPIDERSDLYALGIIFFELLTGRQPFDHVPGPAELSLLPMLKARQRGGPSPRDFNSAVPRAVAAIVQKLLETNLGRRYRTAAHLHEDLERQRMSRPLKYAPDRSVPERMRKWRRTHPRSTFAVLIGTLCLLLLFLPAMAIAIRQHEMSEPQRQIAERQMQAETAEAILLANEMGRKANHLQVLLATRTDDRAILSQGIEEGKAVLARYGIGSDRDWMNHARFTHLPPPLQTQLRVDVAELLLFMARGEQLRADDLVDPIQRIEGLRTALNWNRLAGDCYPEGQIPRLLIRQRNDLLALLRDESANEKRPLIESFVA